jgi:hypothetical protein
MNEIIKPEPEATQGTNAANKYNYQQHPKWWHPRLVAGIGSFVFVAAVVALFIACRYWLGYPYDTPAFVAGAVGLLTLYAIVAQAIIYSRQAEIMQGQAKAMHEQRDIMEQQLNHAEKVFDLVERPVIVPVRAVAGNIRDTSPMHPQITIANKGRTGAVDIVIYMGIIKGKGNVFWDYPGEENWLKSRTPFLGDGEDIVIQSGVEKDITLGPGDARAILDGDEQLLIFGQGSYFDLADRAYTIGTFVFRYERGMLNRFVLNAEIAMTWDAVREKDATINQG